MNTTKGGAVMDAYTVVGYYADTAESYADYVEAVGPYEAMVEVGKRASVDLVLIGAIFGKVVVVPPDEDTGRTAYAFDLAGVPD
jgi:hypothetical protein